MTANTRSGINHESKPPSNRGGRSRQGRGRPAGDHRDSASRPVSLESHASENHASNADSAHASVHRSTSPVQIAGERRGNAPWLEEGVLQRREG